MKSSDQGVPLASGLYEPICSFSEWVSTSVNEERFEPLLQRIAALDLDSQGEGLRWAQDRILRASAFETGAVEALYEGGATYSVAMEVDGWQLDLENSGDGAAHHFEDQLGAYVLVRDLAKNAERPLTEVDVRDLHRIATRSQQTHPVRTPNGVQHHRFISGAYKVNPNQVINRGGGVFHYAPVEAVSPEMGSLVRTVNSADFHVAHPVIQAAYMHWAVAHIHPFADGNGRMARVLGSIPLLRAYGVPLVVFAGRKRGYLQALEAADGHQHQDMVDYVAARAGETLAWLVELIEASEKETAAQQSLADLGRLLASQAEKLETSREAAERVKAALQSFMREECANRFSATNIKTEIGLPREFAGKGYVFNYVRGFTPLEGDTVVTISIDEVANHRSTQRVEVGFGDERVGHAVVVTQGSQGDELFFSLEDCSPDLSVGTELRLRSLVSALVSQVTRKYQNELASIFKQHGRLPG
ncbi:MULTISPECIES: Fic family protein [unclassified Arthrobacter]|uniref:Fic family protein n=1 Tax=unclassified Arthrobacter TaxID=235627 RepID=UPI0028833CE9|nr:MULTISPECIES: Fic family protein [unclassified Arthrobacter]